MIHSSISKLEQILSEVPKELKQKDEAYFASSAPGSTKWSKQQILGHLIDSAGVNLHRFIRAQYEHEPFVYYDQNMWNDINHYDVAKHTELIVLWESLNTRILHVLRHIPDEAMTRNCRVDVLTVMPIQEIVYDYIGHMEHHLKQLLG